jgi:PAS domain S-box-containing protein
MREQEQRQPDMLYRKGDGEALAQGGSGILGAIVEGTTDAVFAKDLEGRYLMINSAAARILGMPKGEIVGKDDAQLLPRETARRLAEVDSRVMATGESSVYEEVLDSPVASQSRTYLSTKGVFRDAGGNVAGIIGISRDITDRKRAEETLRRSEERFRKLAEGIDFIPWEADLATWRFTYVGPQAVKILGYPVEDWYRGSFWVDHIHPEDRVWVADYCAANSATSRHYRFEYRMLASDGRTVWLDDIVSVTEDEDGTKRLQGVMVDVSGRKRAEEAMRNVREAERRRMARALHDGVLQDLSYTTAAMGLIMLEVEGTPLEEELQRTVDALRRSAQGLRDAVNDLRLEGEANRPFPELVASLVERSRSINPERDIRLEVQEGFPSEPLGDAGVELSRVIQEALTNARRHSGAASVRVRLWTEDEYLRAEVADDGCGFGPENEPREGSKSMSERALQLGGTLEVESAPGEGTRVRLRVPMHNASQDAP